MYVVVVLLLIRNHFWKQLSKYLLQTYLLSAQIRKINKLFNRLIFVIDVYLPLNTSSAEICDPM